MKVYAPGKIIISGEHAIVHGAPAIAMAVNRYATTTVTREATSNVMFDLTDLTYKSHLSISALKNIKDRIKRKYKRFIGGDFSIREVLHKPFELVQFAMGLLTESRNFSLPHGVKIQLQSDIPVGCGMGSSAATVLSVMHALSSYLKIPLTSDTLFRLALEAENMQHGFSSGLDLRVAMQGGCIYVDGDKTVVRVAPNLPMYLINSGTPSSSTGECVETVASYFKHSHLCDDFAAITNAIDQALQDSNQIELRRLVRENHALLVRIGVVPGKIQHFIRDIEASGGAAKICGAGAVAGDSAGAVLVLIDDSQLLTQVADKHGYKVMAIQGEARGVHAV